MKTMTTGANMVRRGRSLKNGWVPLPFEVVRRQGLFTVRATGLAEIFPEVFERSATGDYFASRGYGYSKPHHAAVAFSAHLRAATGCVGSAECVGGPVNGNGVQDWIFWAKPS